MQSFLAEIEHRKYLLPYTWFNAILWFRMNSTYEEFNLRSYNSGQNISTLRPGFCSSKIPKLFGYISGATIPFICSQHQGSKPLMKLRNPLGFSSIKNILKDQLFKTSQLQFDNWLLGPEKCSGLSRNNSGHPFIHSLSPLMTVLPRRWVLDHNFLLCIFYNSFKLTLIAFLTPDVQRVKSAILWMTQ